MSPDPRTGLFSSSLVPQRTNVGQETPKGPRYKPVEPVNREFERFCRANEFRPQPASDVEEAFRHGEWLEDREKVRAALVASCVPLSRVERFEACGANCLVEYSPSLNKHRLRANYCQDRFCTPCSRRRSKEVAAEICELAKGERVRFATFTLKKSDMSLNATISRLLRCFRRLRDHEFWKKTVRAGVAVVEITRGKTGDHWHVHLHVLFIGGFIDHDELRAGWKKATGDSFIVDIRKVSDVERGVGYVAKYATKGWSNDVLADPDALIECVLSLRGRRLLIYFGDWHARDDQLCKAQVFDWKRVATLDVIYESALRGDQWAVGVFRSLGFAAGRVGTKPVFLGAGDVYSGP